MGRLAFVFSGGGAKGAFGVGVLRELVVHYPGLRWQIVSGTSTGALITPMAALGSTNRKALDALERFYLTARQNRIVESNLGGLGIVRAIVDLPDGLYNFDPLRDRIAEVMTAARREALKNSDVVAVIHAVSVQSGQLVVCTQNAHRPRLEKWFEERAGSGSLPPYRFVGFGQFEAMMAASSAIPFAIEPEEHRFTSGGPVQQLVDGGVVDIAPLRSAIAAGATDVITVLMSPRHPPAVRRRFHNLLTVGMRAVDLLTDEILRGDVEYAEHLTLVRDLAERLLEAPGELPVSLREWVEERREELEKLRERTPVAVEVVEPPFPLGDTLDFDSANAAGTNIMRTRLEMGRGMARKSLERREFREMVERFA